MKFELHPNLQKKIPIIDLSLCKVLLEDDEFYPWLFLVPRINHVTKLVDLNFENQTLLLKELEVAQRILIELFNPDQINVAAIGIKTPQLHIHVIARHQNDPAWPHTVWDHPVRKKLSEEEKEIRSLQIKKCFEDARFKDFKI